MENSRLKSKRGPTWIFSLSFNELGCLKAIWLGLWGFFGCCKKWKEGGNMDLKYADKLIQLGMRIEELFSEEAWEAIKKTDFKNSKVQKRFCRKNAEKS